MTKRKPRKKGQRRNSPNHSDLYTDENPKGTIKGLKFATVSDAEASVRKIKKSGRGHNHKTQAAIAMEQRAIAAGKKSSANVYRKFIEQQKKKTAAKNESLVKDYVRSLLIESMKMLTEKITKEDLEDVMQTAQLAHLGQTRRDGSSYIMHPVAVQKIVARFYPENLKAQVLAVLHDSLEDGPRAGLTEEELRQIIRGSITDPRDLMEIEEALDLMTHDKSVHPIYADYLRRVFSNPLSSIVKISDLIHNLSHNPSERQIIKYNKALSEVPPPSHVNPRMVRYLYSILGT